MSKAEDIVARAVEAAEAFRQLGQKNTDSVVRAVYLSALAERVRLAKMAHEEIRGYQEPENRRNHHL